MSCVSLQRKNKNGADVRAIRTVKNYDSERTKYGIYKAYQQSENIIIDHSYDNSNNNMRQKKTIQIENINNLNNNTQNLIKNRMNHKNNNNNDAMRINTVTYYSGTVGDDLNKGRSTSTIKVRRNVDNNYTANKIKNDEKNAKKNKNNKSLNKIEIDNGRRTNDNLVFINSNKNTSIKYINKTKNYYTIANDDTKENIIKNNRRKNKIAVECYSNNNNNHYITEKALNEKEYKYNKNSIKIGNNNNNTLIQMSNFEISYESDKGERNAYDSYKKKKKNIMNNNMKKKR